MPVVNSNTIKVVRKENEPCFHLGVDPVDILMLKTMLSCESDLPLEMEGASLLGKEVVCNATTDQEPVYSTAQAREEQSREAHPLL